MPPPTAVIALWQRLLTAVLVFVYFELGYTWAAKGHAPTDLYFAHTRLDDALPLIPFFVVFYMLGYLFVFLPAVMFRRARDYYWGVTLSVVVLTLAFLIFKQFPVYMQKPLAAGTDAFSRLTYLTQAGDVSVNNLPSLHVALNVYCWLLLWLRYGRRMLWVAWAPLLIVASTLLIKQHLLADVIGGLVLGTLAAAAFWRLHRYELAGRIAFRLALLLMLVVLIASWHRLGIIASLVLQAVAEIFERGWLIGAVITAVFLVCAWLVIRRSPAEPGSRL